MELHFIDANEAANLVKFGRGVMIDVREPEEIAAEKIEGSFAYPLSCYNPKVILNNHPEKILIFQCKMGKRAANACLELLSIDPDSEACVLAGGIEGWKDLGQKVVR